MPGRGDIHSELLGISLVCFAKGEGTRYAVRGYGGRSQFGPNIYAVGARLYSLSSTTNVGTLAKLIVDGAHGHFMFIFLPDHQSRCSQQFNDGTLRYGVRQLLLSLGLHAPKDQSDSEGRSCH